MLFHSSLRKELARSFGATLIVLITIIMTMTLIRTLGQASRGSFNPAEVMQVMGFTVIGQMPTILAMSLFIAIVSTLTRMYRDSEMVIWFCSGKGLFGLLPPLIRFSWPILLVVAVLAFGILPWSKAQVEDMKNNYEQRGDLERVEAGRFQESSSGNRVFFVDKDSVAQQSAHQVFISSTDRGKQTITSARSGHLQNIGENSFLMLQNGQQLELVSGQSGLKISEFLEFGSQIGSNTLDVKAYVPPSILSTFSLLSRPSLPHWAELAWRIGLVVATFNFIIIALGVAGSNPRASRSWNMLFAMFAFIIYFNLLNLGQSWIRSGQIGFFEFLLWAHGGIGFLGLLWLAIRHHNWHLPTRHKQLTTPDRSVV
ncbi:MAG: LPS export ABC transporter permease LptF [Burkholderiaceae bacterium]